MKRWSVETGMVKNGDIIKRIIRREYEVNSEMEKKLKQYPVKDLRRAGYTIWQLPKKQKHE